MSQPPLEYGRSQPPPLPPTRRSGSRWLWFSGIACGFALSLIEWPTLAYAADSNRSMDMGTKLLLMPAAVIATKVVAGFLIDRSLKSSGFLPGILLTIALVPLLTVGALTVFCFAAMSR